MDIKDVSHESYIATVIEAAQKGAERDKKMKGQLVRDHPPKPFTIARFMANLREPVASTGPSKHMIHTSQLPAPYLPSALPLSELQPIMISDMRLETHHRGSKALLRVVTPPSRMTAVMAIVEDERGDAVLLQLYHQADESVVPAKEVLRPGICIVKEPYFKRATDGTYSVRVDHVSDIVWLEPSDDRVPQKWKKPALTWSANSADVRKQGNDAVKNEKWAEAERLYSSAIETAATPEEEQLACLNRSLANLRLQRPEKAMSDASRGIGAASSSEKGLFREARALYELGHFQSSLEKLQALLASHPENATAASEMERAKARVHEQMTGEYNFRRMYKQAKKTPPIIDCATFSTPVEVRDAPGKGRGLFTTEAVSAGQLLLCEKAFGYSYVEEGSNFSILMNITTKRAAAGGQVHLLRQIVQKLYHGHEQAREFSELYCGDYTPVPVSEADGIPVVDTFLVERVLRFNAFGAPRTSRASFMAANLGEECMSDGRTCHSTTGIWLLASCINHSCTGNCRRSFIGDMQIVRATMDMPADTELLFTYRQPKLLESYADAQKGTENWGFSCECQLCMDKKATPKSVLTKRTARYRVLKKAMTGSGPTNIAKASAAIEKIEETYGAANGKSIRLEIWDPYFALGNQLVLANKSAEALKMFVKGFEALGYSIIARPAAKTPRLEVERWGLVNEMVPQAFLRLADSLMKLAPELCGRAKKYAEIAYRMVVGESETIGDTFPEFA